MIIKLFVLVIFLGFVCWIIDLCKTDYDRCYSEMESSGVAVFGECCGLSGGTIIFWGLWIIFIGFCVYGFYYLDNRWLD